MPETHYQPFPSFKSFVAAAAFDPATVNPFVDAFAQLKTEVGPDRHRRAVQTARNWASVDTGAIEGLYEVPDRGFTYSVAASALALESSHLDELGAAIEEAIHDAMEGYDYVLDVATGVREVSEQWIKELHSTICRSQETYTVHVLDPTSNQLSAEERSLSKGEYKSLPNNPRRPKGDATHYYSAPGEETSAEMGRLVIELRSDGFQAAHPVLQAAYAHYAYVAVHPFADGNGRVARALASTFLYRSPGVPLVIFVDQKTEYFLTLEQADAGDTGPFIRFVGDRTIDVMNMLEAEMRRPLGRTPAEAMTELRQALQSPHGLAHTEIDRLELRIRQAWSEALTTAITAANIVEPLSVAAASKSAAMNRPTAGYRVAPNSSPAVLNGKSKPPATAEVVQAYGVNIANAENPQRGNFVLVKLPDQVLAEVLVRDVHPSLSASMRFRFDVLAETEVANMVDLLVERGKAQMAKKGY